MSKTQSIRDRINTLIREVTNENNLLLTTPLLVDFFDGDHNAAILLNQILYWTDRTSDPDGWFYKTHHDWFHELRFSAYQVRRVIFGDQRVQSPKRNLWQVGLETVVRMAPNGRNATFYRLDVPQFIGLLVDWLERRFGQIHNQITWCQENKAQHLPSKVQHDGTTQMPQMAEEAITPSKRVYAAWDNFYGDGDTVANAWQIAKTQLEIQFDRANYDTYLRSLVLVDFDSEKHRFTLATHFDHSLPMLQHRLYRNVRRVVSDVYGHETQLVFVSYDGWRLSQRE